MIPIIHDPSHGQRSLSIIIHRFWGQPGTMTVLSQPTKTRKTHDGLITTYFARHRLPDRREVDGDDGECGDEQICPAEAMSVEEESGNEAETMNVDEESGNEDGCRRAAETVHVAELSRFASVHKKSQRRRPNCCQRLPAKRPHTGREDRARLERKPTRALDSSC